MIVFFFVSGVSSAGRDALYARHDAMWSLGSEIASDDVRGVIGVTCNVPFDGSVADMPAIGDCDERGVCRCGCGARWYALGAALQPVAGAWLGPGVGGGERALVRL